MSNAGLSEFYSPVILCNTGYPRALDCSILFGSLQVLSSEAVSLELRWNEARRHSQRSHAFTVMSQYLLPCKAFSWHSKPLPEVHDTMWLRACKEDCCNSIPLPVADSMAAKE